MNKKRKLIVYLCILSLLLSVIVPANVNAATQKVICVSSIRGNTIKYYSVKFTGEVGEAYGKVRTKILSKKVRIYCLLGDSIDATTPSTQVSKQEFIKRVKQRKKSNKKGYYTNAFFQNGKCNMLNEPYFP